MIHIDYNTMAPGAHNPTFWTLTVVLANLIACLQFAVAERLGSETSRAETIHAILFDDPAVDEGRHTKDSEQVANGTLLQVEGRTAAYATHRLGGKHRHREDSELRSASARKASPSSFEASSQSVTPDLTTPDAAGNPALMPTRSAAGIYSPTADGRVYTAADNLNDTRGRMWQNMMAQEYYLAQHEKSLTWGQWFHEAMYAVGGGTGATIGGTGDPALDQDMIRRMRYQDKAVMMFLLAAYMGSLLFSATLAYRQATNNSPVTFYADPRYHSMVIDGSEADVFLDTFNQPPKDVYLQVTGFVPLQDPDGMDSNVDWYGTHYHVAFSFALDLSPWVVRGGLDEEIRYTEDTPHEVGVNREDLGDLRTFLQSNNNDLALVELHKEVMWQGWEELATNIKHQVRQAGFGGIISVHRSEPEIVCIYKNKPWANFMHSRTTKVLWALSLLGWIFYQPYMWLRCASTHVRSKYRIDIPIAQYWNIIEDKIGADGFNDQGGTQRS